MKDKQEQLAFFAATSAFIGFIENFIPLPLLFLRLGLANIPVSLGFSFFKLRQMLYIVLFKVIVTHLFRGTLFSYPFLIALTGNLLMVIAVYPLSFLLKKNRISFVSISLWGALFHNIGQTLVAALFLPLPAVYFLSFFLIFFGCFFGFINGIFCNIIYEKIILRFFYG